MGNAKYALDDLPELPLEALALGGELAASGTAPVLTIRRPRSEPPKPPATPTPLVKKAQACNRKYLVQVIYPRVVCYPITELPNEIVLTPPPKGEGCSDIEATARHESFYKLTSHAGAKLKVPNLCSVKYGPWSAVVIEQESCTFGQPNLFTLFIVEMPDVELSWYGTWEDIPPFPNLQVVMGTLQQVEEGCNCCPGFHWCPTTQSCIPLSIECKDPFPI